MRFDPWFAVAVAIVGYFLVKRLIGGGKVSQSVVKEKLQAGAVVVDVRTPQEFAGGAYRGARNIPVQELAQRMAEIPKGKPVVVYCASGGRSAMAAQMLKRAGYDDVVNAGGLGDMP